MAMRPSINEGSVVTDEEFYSDDDEALLNADQFSRQNEEDRKGWDLFQTKPPVDISGSLANKDTVQMWAKIFKFVSYILTFIVVLGAAALSKGTLFFMISQIKPNTDHDYCPRNYGSGKAVQAIISPAERVSWLWAIFFSFITPEVFTLFRSIRISLFRKRQVPKLSHFIIITLFETLHVIGLAVFVYAVLPFFEVVQGAMLTSCVCLVPAILSFFSRNSKDSRRFLKTIADGLAIVFQLSGCFVWAVLTWTQKQNDPKANLVWLLPISLVLTSFGWWENFVEKASPLGFIRSLARLKESLKETRYFSYMFISLWKMIVFFCSLLLIELAWSYSGATGMKAGSINHLFDLFITGFEVHPIEVREMAASGSKAVSVVTQSESISSVANTAAIVFAIQAGASLMCFLGGKFACKILIQGFSYALPINLAMPVTISILLTFCGLKFGNACYFDSVIPGYLFWECPNGDFLRDILTNQFAWLWVLWLLSQGWISAHLWTPKCERLATTEKLFVHPFYNSLLVDQSMCMNRRRDDDKEVLTSELDGVEMGIDGDLNELYDHHSASSDSNPPPKVRASDSITRIYACATMWHETKDEIVTFLKSIFYMDEDQSARRVAQKYLRIVDPDYYEFETHIFFDDAFELSDDNEDEVVVNPFVKDLVDSMDEAASYVHQTNVRIRPPTKFPTPYGGRLVWTLPGKTKMICHLKDKNKIRHKKRWSQCMYMYYLLGHKLMELPISIERKAAMADNTYILALDGDIDFTPDAVQLLVDLMKRNRILGAACGRIHPVGSGLMAWYQRFEYAIGHWLQKATEHMIGCVLCSPGCFSLFRGSALMADNVMAKYTTVSNQARHYVQYDQGEDRWLCTLMLQQGYRVEYSAASDAYTHCPEGFNEFFNQRRRWVPSTMANILDLLVDYQRTVKVNDNISMPYIFYQVLLMVGTVVGPGTIFLMIVGSVCAAFKIDQWTSFIINLIPIIIFMIACLTTKSDVQLMIAQLLSIFYAVVMMAVLVGIVLELNVEGLESPSGIFLIMTAASFVLSALLHPQEFWCLPFGLVYYLTVPSMYLLLIIYSLSNLNNVSWGTRETVEKKKKPTPQELAEAKKAAEEAKKQAKMGVFGGLFQSKDKKDDDEGSLEFSLAGLFKIMCCVHKKPQEEMQQLMRIAESLNSLNRRLDSIERTLDPSGSVMRRRSISSRASIRTSRDSGMGSGNGTGPDDGMLSVLNEADEDSIYNSDVEMEESVVNEPVVERDDMVNPYWIDDRSLKRGEVEFLGGPEVQFFKELMEKYLRPLDEDKESKKKAEMELKELRNNTVFAFYIINALYVTVVFLLTLEKERVYIRWPFGEKYKLKYTYDISSGTGSVEVDTEFLKLEPIGFVFVVFFGSVLVIQFVAMLFHRFGTMSHILASTDVTICSKKMDDISEDAYIQENGVEMARQLQKLRGIEEDDNDSVSNRPKPNARRGTVHLLGNNRINKPTTENLDMAFRKRLMSIVPDNLEESGQLPNNIRRLSLRRDTLQALGRRRSTLVSEIRRRSSVHLAGPRDSISIGRRDSGFPGSETGN